MRDKRDIDPAIASLAGRQGGVVGIAQLLNAGLTRPGVAAPSAAGRLHPLYRGVYAVGHRSLAVTGRRWAAVLACAPGAALSDRSAGSAWGSCAAAAPGSTSRPWRAARAGRDRAAPKPGWRLTRSPRCDGLPITTPARTLLDLAATLTPKQLGTAISRAEQQRLLDFADLHDLLRRHPRRPGSPSLRAVLDTYAPRDTRSALEDLIAELEIEPPPHSNVVIEHAVRDFAWPRQRLVVEADSYTWHRSPAALDADRERDVTLALGGWRTLRFTYAQVTTRPGYVAGAIRAALAG